MQYNFSSTFVDNESLRRYMDQYLAVDSVSEWAELIRMGDTLIFQLQTGPPIKVALTGEGPVVVQR